MDKPRHLHTLKDAKETVANSRSLSNLKTNSPNQQRKPSNNLQLTQSPRVNSTFIQQSHSPQPVRSSSGGKLSIRTSTSVSGGLTKLSPTKASPTERISTYRPAELRMQSYIPSKSSVNIGPSTNDVHLEADEDAPPVPKLNTQLYGAESSMALGSPNRQASHSVLNSFQVINVQEVSAVDLDNVVMKTKSQSTTDHDFVQDDTQHGISSMSPRYTKTLKKKGTFNSSSKSTHQSNVSENPADKSINIIHFISMVIFFILVALKSSFVYTGPIQQELGISSICLILVVCFAVHEAWRLIETVDKNSVIMFYISGVSFAVTLITAPSSRWLCLSVWPFLLLSFLLQSNGRNLYRQMIYISIFNSGLYIISLIIVQKVVYICNNSTKDLFLCINNFYRPLIEIDWGREILLSFSCLCICFSFVKLQTHIENSVAEMLKLSQIYAALKAANKDYERQLRRIDRVRETEIDLVSPVLKVIATLAEIQERDDTSFELSEMIDVALKALCTDELMAPTNIDANADSDVQQWLQNVLRTEKNANSRINMNDNVDDSSNAYSNYEKAENSDSELAVYLKQLDSPYFDALQLQEIVPNGLVEVSKTLIQKHNLFQKLSINKKKFIAWAEIIEAGYPSSNPYHNAAHATDVTFMMNYFMTRRRFFPSKGGLPDSGSCNFNMYKTSDQAISGTHGSLNQEKVYRFSSDEVLAGLLAAMIHDFRHPGVTNAFLVNTQSPIALRYNDRAVLENFHIASAFEAMKQSDSTNFLSTLTREKQKSIRDAIIAMVLATDMSAHFEFIGRFKNKIISVGGIEWDKPADRKLVLAMALKTADINNITKPTEISVKWTEMYTAEVFKQGDEERRLGLTISPFMNRENHDIPKSQIGFIDFLVRPLYEPWIQFVGTDIEFFLEALLMNRNYWFNKNENSLRPSSPNSPKTSDARTGSFVNLSKKMKAEHGHN